jgi:hypothetical protein
MEAADFLTQLKLVDLTLALMSPDCETLQRSFLIVERGAGVSPLRGGSAPTPLVRNQFVNAVSQLLSCN